MSSAIRTADHKRVACRALIDLGRCLAMDGHTASVSPLMPRGLPAAGGSISKRRLVSETCSDIDQRWFHPVLGVVRYGRPSPNSRGGAGLVDVPCWREHSWRGVGARERFGVISQNPPTHVGGQTGNATRPEKMSTTGPARSNQHGRVCRQTVHRTQLRRYLEAKSFTGCQDTNPRGQRWPAKLRLIA